MEERVGRPEKLPLTAVVMTFNEAGRIRKCLRSLSFAGELIVVDSGSTDGTREIASQEGARVVERAWPGDYADQRNFGDSLASFDWILQLDADEQVSPEMEEELKAFFSSPRKETYGGGRFPRKEIIFGKWVRGGGWYPQYKLRLYRKGTGRWVGKVHERFETESPVWTFTGAIIHDSYDSVHTFVEKFNRYSTYDAEEDFRQGRRFSLFRLFFRPLERFFGRYVKHRGFRDGWRGFFLALLIAWSYAVREMKLREMWAREEEK